MLYALNIFKKKSTKVYGDHFQNFIMFLGAQTFQIDICKKHFYKFFIMVINFDYLTNTTCLSSFVKK